jgi:hypothetical protein
MIRIRSCTAAQPRSTGVRQVRQASGSLALGGGTHHFDRNSFRAALVEHRFGQQLLELAVHSRIHRLETFPVRSDNFRSLVFVR